MRDLPRSGSPIVTTHVIQSSSDRTGPTTVLRGRCWRSKSMQYHRLRHGNWHRLCTALGIPTWPTRASRCATRHMQLYTLFTDLHTLHALTACCARTIRVYLSQSHEVRKSDSSASWSSLDPRAKTPAGSWHHIPLSIRFSLSMSNRSLTTGTPTPFRFDAQG